MPTGDIYIYGVIRNEQSEEMNSIWGEVSLTSVKEQINELPEDVDELIDDLIQVFFGMNPVGQVWHFKEVMPFGCQPVLLLINEKLDITYP